MKIQTAGLILMGATVYFSVFAFIGAKVIDYLDGVTRIGYEKIALTYCLAWVFLTGLVFYLIG